jgi:hypothetical protein
MSPREIDDYLIEKLKPHPRNYQGHPDDQLEHIASSIRANGVYRRIVIANDDTILAGHGVVKAANEKLGMTTINVIRLDIEPDSPAAMKVLTGDNKISQLAEIDDRALTEILKSIKEEGETLDGTGFDDMMLANLVYVTRPESEIADFDAAAEWIGMPEYDEGEEPLKIIVSFRDENDRMEFCQILGLDLTEKQNSTWYPPKDREDLSSLRFAG